jgi:hypothetical protein
VGELIEHHHLVRRPEGPVQPVRELLGTGCIYILFSDFGRTPERSMKVVQEVVTGLKAQPETLQVL